MHKKFPPCWLRARVPFGMSKCILVSSGLSKNHKMHKFQHHYGQQRKVKQARGHNTFILIEDSNYVACT